MNNTLKICFNLHENYGGKGEGKAIPVAGHEGP
jgi:hypothetical protein